MKRRKATKWKDALGLILWAAVIAAIAFAQTRQRWYDDISHGDKALFWASVVTAGATTGLFVVAVIAARFAYNQLVSSENASKVHSTTDLLREWSSPELRTILAAIDSQAEPQDSRRHARLLYLFAFNDESKPTANTSSAQPLKVRIRKWRRRRRRSQELINNSIESVALIASRTWNMLAAGIVDEKILFSQLDYDIVATYYILEDVLARRQHELHMMYAEFTRLAKKAQIHYKRRPEREIFGALAQIEFDALPYTDDEFESYAIKSMSREAAWRLEKGNDALSEQIREGVGRY